MRKNNALDFLNNANRFIGLPLSEAGKSLQIQRTSGHFKDWGEHSYWDELEHRRDNEQSSSLKGLPGAIIQHLFTGNGPDSKSGKDSFYEVKSFEVWLKDGEYIPKEKFLKIGSLNYQEVLDNDFMQLDILSKVLQSFWVPILIPPPPCWKHKAESVNLKCSKCKSTREIVYDSFYRLERAIIMKPIVFVPDANQLRQIAHDFDHYKGIIKSGDQSQLSAKLNKSRTKVLMVNTSGQNNTPKKQFLFNGELHQWKSRSWYMHPNLKAELVRESGKIS